MGASQFCKCTNLAASHCVKRSHARQGFMEQSGMQQSQSPDAAIARASGTLRERFMSLRSQ